MRFAALVASLATVATASSPLSAQTAAKPERHRSIAIEADAIAYGLPGYSGILSLSLPNGFQVAFGTGRYEVPSLLLKGDENYDSVQWKATSTSVQVLRMTYRLRGPMQSGLALGGVVLNQNWKLRSEKLAGSTRFRPLSMGMTAGYYLHVTKHFYVYPTTAFTYNNVVSGTPELQGNKYKVAKFAPNASLHVGWEWAR